MSLVTMTEAAKLAGVSRSNFYNKYLQTSKIKYVVDFDGKNKIDTDDILKLKGELTHVFQTVSVQTHEVQNNTSENTSIIRALEDKVTRLQEQLVSKDALIKSKEERIEDFQKFLLLLEDKIKKDVVSDAAKEKKAWYKF